MGFHPVPESMRDLRGHSGSAPEQIFSTKCVLRLAGLHGPLPDPLDFCRLFSSLGPVNDRGKFPNASLRSGRRTVLVFRVVKERDQRFLFDGENITEVINQRNTGVIKNTCCVALVAFSYLRVRKKQRRY